MIDVKGDGYVIAQEPAAGAPLGRIKLTLGSMLADASEQTTSSPAHPSKTARSVR
jgi:hypothetical protein